jgi:asparagine synthase (glutamine-hydrolysing)
VVHFLWSLPPEWKLSQGKTKVIVRELLMRHFPEDFFNRPKKGFSLPVDIWLRTGLRDWAESLLSDSALAASGQLRIPVVQRYWQEHLSGRQNHQHKLWSVLQFQNWWFAQKRS